MTKQEQAMRLYKAVERLALQAGEETDESIDWLCGEHGGMFKLYEAYFLPEPPQRKPLSDEFCITDMIDVGHYSLQLMFKSRKHADEFKAAHGIKGDA